MDSQRIIRGGDGLVEIDEINRTVTKTYLYLEHEVAVRKMKREVCHASRLLDALSPVPRFSVGTWALHRASSWSSVPGNRFRFFSAVSGRRIRGP